MGAFGRRGWSKTPAPQRDSLNSSRRDNALCSLPCARHLQVCVIPLSPHNSHFTDEETGVQSLADLWEIQLGFNSRAHVFTAAVLDFSDTVGQLGGTGVGAGTGSQGELGLTGPAPAERGWRRRQHSHSALCPCLLGVPRSSAPKHPWARCLSLSLHLAFRCPHLCCSLALSCMVSASLAPLWVLPDFSSPFLVDLGKLLSGALG